MILRIVRGRVAADRRSDVMDWFLTTYVPAARRLPGLVRYRVGFGHEGDEREFVAVTFWISVEAALAAYDGDLAAVRVFVPVPDAVTLTRVEYYEIDESVFRRGAEPTLLRITVGRTEHGHDAEIQQELRHRLPELGDELAEAYVGRRIVGGAVDVAFISTWHRAPAGRHLEAAIWPDISSAYEQFEVVTYDLFLSGVDEEAIAADAGARST